MPRLSANISMLFGELDFEKRFGAAAKAGFKGVEYLFPYEHSRQSLAQLIASNGLQQVMFNFPCGDWEAGERGIACLPHRQEEYREGVEQGLEYARALSCTRVNVLAGRVPDEAKDHAHFVGQFTDNLRWTAKKAAEVGVTVLVEAVSTQEIPGYLLNSTAEMYAVLEDLAIDNIALQHDIYHMQITEGNLAHVLEHNIKHIGHIQVADNPGRHEPGTGEINYEFILKVIDQLGYKGWVGCEYKPLGDTVAGLAWASKWLG